jgi:hypothetical protein
MIVGGLNGSIPPGLWLAVVSDSFDESLEWLKESGFTLSEDDLARHRVMLLSPDEVRSNLGEIVTPLAVEIEGGRLARAKTVPSVRQFYALIPSLLTLPKALA